jgi:DNA-directed RNA polymerase specialized sigma24 family protein
MTAMQGSPGSLAPPGQAGARATGPGGAGGAGDAGGVGGVESDDELFARIYPGLLRFAGVVAPPEVGPDDLLQEAMVRALRGGSVRRLDNPEAYLRRTMVNLAANERRRLGRWRRARGRLGAGTDAGEVESYPSDVSDLLALPVDARAVLWLADVEGWSFDQVAAVLGCTPDAARARASRARWALRHLLQEREAEA